MGMLRCALRKRLVEMTERRKAWAVLPEETKGERERCRLLSNNADAAVS